MPERAPWLPGLSLRPMAEADVPQVSALEAQSQFTPWSEQVFRDCLRDDYLCQVVTAIDGTLAAFVVISRVLDEAHLLNIAVASDWQRRGIARALLGDMMAALAAESRYLFLEVRAGNAPARALYEQLGFSVTGVRRGYYRSAGGPEDAVLMMRPLP